MTKIQKAKGKCKRAKKAENMRKLKENRHAYFYLVKALSLRCQLGLGKNVLRLFQHQCLIYNLDGRYYSNTEQIGEPFIKYSLF